MQPRASPTTAQEPAADSLPANSPERTAHQWLGLLLVVVLTLGLMEARLVQPGLVFTAVDNVQIAEAQAWWHGRLDLPERFKDTALWEGRVYSHFPLLFTLTATAAYPFFQGVPHWLLVALCAIGTPALAYELFRRATGRAWAGALLAIGLVCGTSVWPVINQSLRSGSMYYVNHALATLGLLMFLAELFGRGRVWVAGAGLLCATLARQLTACYLIPLFWMAVARDDSAARRRGLLAATAVAGVIAAVPLAANALKFGNPLTTGYMLIYDGRDDAFARDAREHGLFSPHFIPRNLYYMNLGFPLLHERQVAGSVRPVLEPNVKGTGIWWTSPLLLWLLVDGRRLWRDGRSRSLLVAAGLVFGALMLFHATGADQRGYNRFSLDYVPVLFAALAPSVANERRRWITFATVVWSVVYFRWLI